MRVYKVKNFRTTHQSPNKQMLSTMPNTIRDDTYNQAKVPVDSDHEAMQKPRFLKAFLNHFNFNWIPSFIIALPIVIAVGIRDYYVNFSKAGKHCEVFG